MPNEIQSENVEAPASKAEAIKNLIVILVVIFGAYVLTLWVGVDRLRHLAEAAGMYGIFALVLLKITTIIVVPIGGGPIYPIAGAVYGFWWGWGLTLLGDFLGFTAAFFLSRRYGRSVARLFIPKTQWAIFDRILEKSTKRGTFLKARLAFATFPEIFAYAAGLTKVGYWPFIFSMMIIQAPGSAFFTLFGDILLSGDPHFFIPVAIVGGLIVLASAWLLQRDLVKD